MSTRSPASRTSCAGRPIPTETLGAQEIKAQTGSRRIKNCKDDLARFCKDIGQLVAEVIAEQFQPQTLADMTGYPVHAGHGPDDRSGAGPTGRPAAADAWGCIAHVTAPQASPGPMLQPPASRSRPVPACLPAANGCACRRTVRP